MAGPAPRVVVAEPLTDAAFAPFGEVLEAGRRVGRDTNQGTAVRLDHAVTLESTRPAARPDLAVFTCAPQSLPFTVRLLECHPHSSQMFAPMACGRWLVCVAPESPDGGPDPGALRAFVCTGPRGINLRRGVWHHPIVALDVPATLVMLAWEDGSRHDCVEHPLGAPIVVEGPRGHD